MGDSRHPGSAPSARSSEEQAAALRELALKLSMAEARERRRIAEELHDHLGQYLALAKMKLSAFNGNTIFCGHEQELLEIQGLLDKAIHYTRHLTMAVSPPMLYELGLVPALQWLADQYGKRHDLRITVQATTPVPEFEDDIRGMIYRSMRELLLNVVKHAGARHVELSIHCASGRMIMSLVDDGRGFSPESLEPGSGHGFGLFSIRERLRHLGGHLELESRPGHGTRVTLQCPVGIEDPR